MIDAIESHYSVELVENERRTDADGVLAATSHDDASLLKVTNDLVAICDVKGPERARVTYAVDAVQVQECEILKEEVADGGRMGEESFVVDGVENLFEHE